MMRDATVSLLSVYDYHTVSRYLLWLLGFVFWLSGGLLAAVLISLVEALKERFRIRTIGYRELEG